jgi:ferritin-like metal-binding protein YciE
MSEQNNANPKLQEFFVTSLQEIYWSETHLINVLTSMGKASTDPKLKEAFDLHAEQTQTHVERLQQVFNNMGLQPQAEPSVGLQGLFDEGWQVIDETEDGSAVRDVALIVAAQKVEHYEIACYGSLITLAKTIGLKDVAKILGPTLEEEKETDLTLTSIAQSGINEEASEEEGPATGSQSANAARAASGFQATDGSQGSGVNMEQGVPSAERMDDAGLEINQWAQDGQQKKGAKNAGGTDDSGFGAIDSGAQSPDKDKSASGAAKKGNASEPAINEAAENATKSSGKGGKKGKSKAKA